MSIREKLDVPFPDVVLGELPKAGITLTYVPVAEVITRLNQVLGTGGWSYTVEDHWTATNEYTFFDKKTKERKSATENWVMAHVRVIALVDDLQCARDGIGGYNTSKPGMDYADGYKSAVSEGLKKAAQALGVGLHLSRKEEAIAFSIESSAPRADNDAVQYLVETIKGSSDDLKAAVRARGRDIGVSYTDMTEDHYNDLRVFIETYLAPMATEASELTLPS